MGSMGSMRSHATPPYTSAPRRPLPSGSASSKRSAGVSKASSRPAVDVVGDAMAPGAATPAEALGPIPHDVWPVGFRLPAASAAPL